MITIPNPGRDTNYFNNIPRQFLGCSHPFLLPIAMAEADFNRIMPFTATLFDRLREIEKLTGFTNHRAGDELTQNVNYQPFIRALGELHMYYSDIQTMCSSFQLLVKYLQSKLAVIESSASKHDRDLKRSSIELRTRMEFFSSSLEYALIYGNFQRRLDAQQDAVCTFVRELISAELSKLTRYANLAIQSHRSSRYTNKHRARQRF